MRAVAAVLTLSLAFVLLPAAQAEPVPPGPCPTKSYVDGAVHVYTTVGCGVFIDVLGNTDCLWGGDWVTVAEAGNVAVRAWVCDPEYVDPTAGPTTAAGCTCDPNPLLLLVVALLQQGPCALDAAAYDVYHSYYVNRVDGDCVIDAYPPYECVGGWGHDEHVNVGFLHLTVRVCTGGPFPPPAVGALLEAVGGLGRLE